MKKSIFGKIMEVYREKYDIQQKAICEGICSEATYLRAEMEEYETAFVVQETLLARVGQSADRFELILDEEDYELWTKRLAIRLAFAGKQFSVVQEKVKAYREENADKGKLHEQFCLYHEMKLAEWLGESEVHICQIAEKALSLTKSINLFPEKKYNLFTPMEMDLLLAMLQYQSEKWSNPQEMEKVFLKIIEYAEEYFDLTQQEDIQGRAWIELLKLEEKHGTTDKLLTYIDSAISCFAKATANLRLAEVHFIKARVLYRTCPTAEDYEVQKQLVMEECRMAYGIYDAMDCVKEREEIERFCMEELEWHITMQIKSSDLPE